MLAGEFFHDVCNCIIKGDKVFVIELYITAMRLRCRNSARLNLRCSTDLLNFEKVLLFGMNFRENVHRHAFWDSING